MDETTAHDDPAPKTPAPAASEARAPTAQAARAVPAPAAAVPAPRTERTRLRRHADRAVPDRIEEFLRAGLVAHVACVEEGEPRIIPFLYHYEAGRVYLHGSPGNATLRRLRDGRPVAISVTMIDGMVASKTEPDHSANYRSVALYGRGRQIADVAEKRRVLRLLLVRYFPDRHAPTDFSAATDDDLTRMELIAIEIDEAQAKAREGGPMGPRDSDPNAAGSASVRSI
jgi:nitroimidazol reductase NimA-like FMN-containing flavoprotein (pyridoxamine 5'-phosphate oxidase superfamily)